MNKKNMIELFGAIKPVLVSLFVNPRTIAGIAPADAPHGGYDFLGPIVASFDPIDSTIMYAALPTNNFIDRLVYDRPPE